MSDPKTPAEALRRSAWQNLMVARGYFTMAAGGGGPHARFLMAKACVLRDVALDDIVEAERLEALPPAELTGDERRDLAVAWFENCPDVGLCSETLDRFLERIAKRGLAITRVKP